MSTLLSTLGRWSFRHPWRVLIGWLIVLGIAGGGALTLGSGTDDTFSIPGTESQAGLEQLERTFPQVSGTNAQFIVVAADGDDITDAEYRDSIEDAVDEIARFDGVLAATSPYDENIDGMVNDEHTAAIVRMQFDGQSTDVPDSVKDDLQSVVDDLGAELPEGSQTALGGDLFAMSMPTITLTEAVGVVIALLVLIVTFRSFVVAGLPLLTALLGVGVSMAGIFAATAFATVSSTTPLLALMLGLAVGIDYALFIIARHQDQVRSGVDPEESASRAVGTAGSAVVFAGITVLIALIGLGFAGIPFLTTMGIAAAVAVAIAVAISVTLTPALLGFVKGRVAGRPRRARRAAPAQRRRPSSAASMKGGDDDQQGREPSAARASGIAEKSDAGAPASRPGFAARWVGGVTKKPILVTIAVVLGLGVVAVPALSLNLALPNAGVLPKGSEARINYDLTAEQFGPGFNGPLILTGTIVTSTDPLTLMEDLGEAVEQVPGVREVALATPNETADTGIVQIVPETAPDDPATSDLVRELRSHHDEWLDEFGIDLKVTGFTAVAIDISDQLGAALLPFGVFVIGLSLILLAIVFRSIWVPITAAAGYLLSIVASFGVVAAVFEWGWFADLLHVARTGPIISFMPIVLMGVLFGLAMDYQVFLVSRMREDYVHDPASDRRAAIRAVRSGFTSSARVVTAAALIMFAVFVAFVPEGDSSLKPIALGLAAGIAIDAFLVRMTLIPAVMAILGDRAWRIPRWMERILPHVDIEGEAVERERALAGWPGDDSILAADDLALDAAGIENAHLRVAPAGSLIITGVAPRGLRMLALTLAGRVKPDSGRLRVAGHLLPGRAAWVRAHVGVVLLGGSDAASDVSEALRGRTRLVVIDGVDRLSAHERDQLAARLRDADAETAVVLTTADSDAAQQVLAEAGRPAASVVDLSSADTPTSRPDPVLRASTARGVDDSTGSRRQATDAEVDACAVLSERTETK